MCPRIKDKDPHKALLSSVQLGRLRVAQYLPYTISVRRRLYKTRLSRMAWAAASARLFTFSLANKLLT
jgi:hypothetical protein